MAGFFKQLRLLLWKNALSVIRQPGWSLVLLIWPVVIFIILAVTRSQFPPKLKYTCYVGPRNLPSAGFFPFLQTLMCKTDSTCYNKSFLASSRQYSRAYNTWRIPRSLRDTESQSPSWSFHGLPPLEELRAAGLVHEVSKRDTSNQSQILQQWDKVLNSSVQVSSNISSSIMNAFNETIQADQDTLSSILDSASTLKEAVCGLSMSAINMSGLQGSERITSGLTRFCTSNDPALEISLSTLNQMMVQVLLQDPQKAIEKLEMAVGTIIQLQKQTSLWDFLLGLPDIFLKSTEQERAMAVANEIMRLKGTLISIQSSFKEANVSLDSVNPFINKSISVLNYAGKWKGKNVNISLYDVLNPPNGSEISLEMMSMLQKIYIPLDKVFVLESREEFSTFMCTNNSYCDGVQIDTIYGWISQEKIAEQVLSAWSKSASTTDLAFVKSMLGNILGNFSDVIPNTLFSSIATQAQTLPEQLLLGIGSGMMGVMAGLSGQGYVDVYLKQAYAFMQTATTAMEAQLAFIKPLLQDAETLMASLTQNKTAASINNQLMDVVQEMEMKVNKLSSVTEGSSGNTVTLSMMLPEWNRLMTTAQQYSSVIQQFVGKLLNGAPTGQNNSSAANGTVDWSKILLTRGLEELAVLGSPLQNSSDWSAMEQYLQRAYWIMTFTPDSSSAPNCTFRTNGTDCEMMAFSWEKFISVLGSLIRDVNQDPAAVLRPIQGVEALTENTIMMLLQDVLRGPMQAFPGGRPQDLMSGLTDLINQNIQLLLSNATTPDLKEDALLAMLNNTLEAFGLEKLRELWSESKNGVDLNSLVMSILQSAQLPGNEGYFGVLDLVLRGLGEALLPEQQNQIAGILNGTHGLLGDLERCGVDCLSELPQVLQTLSSLNQMITQKAKFNVTLPLFKSNLTLSMVGHLLSILQPWNVSGSPAFTNDVNTALGHLQKLSSLPSVSNMTFIQALKALNMTLADLKPLAQLSNNSALSSLVSNIKEIMNISDCLNPTSPQEPIDCTTKLVDAAIGFLKLVPMPQGFQIDLPSVLSLAHEQAMQYVNMSSLGSKPLKLTYEVIESTLSNIRQNLQSLGVKNVTSIKSELDVLEGLLKLAFDKDYRYPYYLLNSTLMMEQTYAQKMYGEIASWYLQKLENATNSSMFAEFLKPFIRTVEMMVSTNAAESNFFSMAANQIKSLIGNVQPPLDGADLTRISDAVMTLVQGELNMMKMSLEIQQDYYNSMGLQANLTIPTQIEGPVTDYLKFAESWITNPQLKLALGDVLQWNNTNVTTAGMDLEQLIQAAAPLLSPEEREYIKKLEQVSQALNHALQLGGTQDGLRSENFTQAVMDAARLALENFLNGSVIYPTSAPDQAAEALQISLELILNQNLSYAQSQGLLKQAAQRMEDFIRALSPETAKMLTPGIQSIATYINSISQPGGTDNWNKVVVSLMEGVQDSLPFNSSARDYVSVFLDLANSVLRSNQGNVSLWTDLVGLNPRNFGNVAQQLGKIMDTVLPLLTDNQEMGMTLNSAQAVAKSVPVLMEIFSGRGNQTTFQGLENVVTGALSGLASTPVWGTLPSTLGMLNNITAGMIPSVRAETDLINSLSGVLTDIFSAVNSSDVPLVLHALPQALRATIGAALQSPMKGQTVNCSEVQKIWDQVGQAAKLNITVFHDWCNTDPTSLTNSYQTSAHLPTPQNMTGLDPRWLNSSVAEIVGSLETLYSATFNDYLSVQRLSQNIMERVSMMSNLSSADQAEWNNILIQLQSLSFVHTALENVAQEQSLRPYALALDDVLQYSLQYQNAPASPEMVVQALDVALTAMNISREQINRFLSSAIFTRPDVFSMDVLIKEAIGKVIEMKLLGDWPAVYKLMDQVLYVDNSSRILEAANELVNWYNVTQDSGMNLATGTLSRLYGMVTSVLPSASQLGCPVPCNSNLITSLASNALSLMKLLGNTTSVFTPFQDYLRPIQAQLDMGQNLNDLLSATKSARAAQNSTREPIDDLLDLFGGNYQDVFQALSGPLSSEETLETMHVFFSNPDLGIFLKGWTRDMTKNSGADGTIGETLAMLSALTLRNNANGSMSNNDFASYLRPFASALPPQEAEYLNISAQMMSAFASLASNPTDVKSVKMSAQEIASSLSRSLVVSNAPPLPNGQSLEDIAYPLILSSAFTSEVLFNLSASNYTLGGGLDPDAVLTQAFKQYAPMFPAGAEGLLHPLRSALAFALSNMSNTAEIRPAFFQISQNVTMSMLKYLNLTGEPAPMGMGMSSKNLTDMLFTASNQVSRSLYEGLTMDPSSIQVPFVLSSLEKVMSSLSAVLPPDAQRYSNASFDLLQLLVLPLNQTNNTNMSSGISQLSSSVQNLLNMIPGGNMSSAGGVVSDLEQSLKRLLVLSSGGASLAQGTDMTQEILQTIEDLLKLANSSSELDLARQILGAAEMNVKPLLTTNESNWVQHLPLMLTYMAGNLPADLQFGSFNSSMIARIANETQEKPNILMDLADTTFKLLSTNWSSNSFGGLLQKMQTQVCSLENMTSVQHFTQALSISPGLLCNTALPTIQALRTIAVNLGNDSARLTDLLYQELVGDPNTYDLQVDWTSVISSILGVNISALTKMDDNFSAPGKILLSAPAQEVLISPGEIKISELLKDKKLFMADVTKYTSFPPAVLAAMLEMPLPNSNLQLLSMLTSLHYCDNPSTLQLDQLKMTIFKSLCSLSPQEWYNLALVLARHANMQSVMYKMFLSSEIQSLVQVLIQVVKFFMDIMKKLAPALDRLEGYLTKFGDLKLMSNPEFRSLVRGKRSTMSSRATFVTISRALCRNGMLTLFGISKLPDMAQSSPSVQEQQKVEELMTKFKIPRDATPFCTNFYLDMVSTTGGAVAWAFLKPMLLGQVLYYPDTPLTREIVQKSNTTLQQFGDLRLYSEEWLRSSSYLMQSAQLLNKSLPILKNSLRSPFVQNFIQEQTGINVTQMQGIINSFSNMTQMLEKNQFVLDQITTLSNLMMNLSSCVNFNRYRGYNSTEELDKQADKQAQNRELYASLIFKLPEEYNSSSSKLPPKVDYTIRMHIDNAMRTDRARNPFWVKATYISPTKTQRYNRGFIYLQESIERAIIQMQTGTEVQEPAVQIQAFPYPCFYKDDYLNSITFAFPLVLMISWVLFVANFVKKLVHERELRLHEYMKMMGVNPFSHFLAWFIESAVFLIITVILLTIILKEGGVLPKSDGFVLFLYLSDYGLSILAISFLASSFFDKTNIAGLSGSLIYVICFFPFIVVMCLEENLPFYVKSLLSLFSPTCFSYASQYVTRYEKQEEGIQWSNMYSSPVAGDTASFGWLCWLLLIDSFIYFVLGAYIRMVFPGNYGIAAPWYFPFQPSFWADMFGCCNRGSKDAKRGLLFSNVMQESQRNGKDQGKGKDDFFSHSEVEDVLDLPVGVSLHGLTKVYGSRKAVDNLNLKFYEGHVTALLGHNGAGKTTTMSLLTGLFAPSFGTIKVYGKDMRASTEDVRKELGVCMQYDVHFDHLTTEEHLLLYGQIKAPHWSKQELQQEVRKILEETGMYTHRHKRVGTLSGGMKRKLSISIAFIGGSRLVVLDEPTTGVDPCSRRSIWDIVLQQKNDRTIILSTHHLDEAEVLSDRIAFLERGGLKCCGSPFYLKDKLAQGYNLTLTKKVLPPDSDDKFDIEQIRSFIHAYLPEARLKDGEVGDIGFHLPAYNSQNASAYRSLLGSLDQNLDKLQLGCYGISDTTLEEVFLQLTRDDLEAPEERPNTVPEVILNPAASTDSLNDDDDFTSGGFSEEKTSLTGNSTVSGFKLLVQQVLAMLLKRIHHSRRDWKGLISQVLLPVVFVIAAMGLGSIKSNLEFFPELELSPALYNSGKQYAFFSNQNPNSSYLVDAMMSYPGLDHFCMDKPNNDICRRRETTVTGDWAPDLSQGSLMTGECNCSDFSQTCPKSGIKPSYKTNPSSQIVYNLSKVDIERYLLTTANDFVRDRYGGWSFGDPLPRDLQMDVLEVPSNRTLTKVWYNPEGHHTMPAYLNSLNNFILRSRLPADKHPEKYAISLSSHPYPGEVEEEDAILRNMVNVLVALCILTGFSIMTASFVIYEVQEHHSGSKRLQHISGISEPFYWIVNFFYDMALYMVPVLCSVIVIAAFQLPAFTERLNLGAVTLLLVLFGFASFPWMYLVSAMFKDPEMAFISYVCINLFISMNTIISTAIIYFLGQANQDDQHIQSVYHTMSQVFLIFPQFCFGNGLMELARVDLQVQILSMYGVDAYKNPFSMDVLGWMFISLFLQGSVCFLLRLLLNKWLIRKFWRLVCRTKSSPRTEGSWAQDMDEDVIAESRRVDGGGAGSDLLQVSQLSKVYRQLNRRVQAVKKLSFGIPAGECFGLLGVNGAGKTTTFKMLTGDISPTHGSAQLNSRDGRIVDIMDCRTEGINIGYCPQVDALDELLTGEEHLYFYARIRGIAKREIDQVVNYLLKKLELNYHRNVISERYSCGTRRKLSTALALIGQPQILLLDEPSSGMDPRSKRHLWKIISEEVMGKCAVVLTSHSMEECEALCTRLAIMVQGQFRCLGSLQHIKNRFGSGFTVKMYLTSPSCSVEAISRFMEQHFPSTCLKDHHSSMLEYHVPVAPGGVADIFDQLESNKAALQIKHFSVSQTTLDEVFINFAMGKIDGETQDGRDV
ncbi:glucosylceramide transporter ABCA12 [Trichomycterus rosablanca]|uniref:glucosylceramide transporter ABCA12 n=1 Tax=Trichomycterus rosablanca TaxID=2290929 RepID=UPI002F355139